MVNRYHHYVGAPMKTLPADTGKNKDTKLPYPFKDNSWDPSDKGHVGGLYGNNPSNIKDELEYDPKTGQYNFKQKMGDMNYRNPSYMTMEEYLDYDMKKALKDNWKKRQDAENVNNPKNNLIPPIHVAGDAFDRIFGGNTVDIRPQGSAELIFGVNTSRNANPALTEKQRKVSTFNFDQKIQINMIGKIGDKLKLTLNYNTEAAFDWENQTKLEYTGYEDEIIKKIEAGNVSLPLNGSLITGSQSLFGIKTKLQFGRLTMTTIFSQQKGKKSEIEVSGGAQVTKFEVLGDNYESNRHFFLSQYFRDNYERALSTAPILSSKINIARVEVWVTNENGVTDNTRNIVAFADLGESKRTNSPANYPNQSWFAQGFITDPAPANDSKGYPDNKGSNDLYTHMNTLLPDRGFFNAINTLSVYNTPGVNFAPVQDYEVIENARKLSESEYTFHPRLGFISLNSTLSSSAVLSVAYQYTVDGKTYQVGEFSNDGVAAPKALFLKMLKATSVRIKLPIWDLMMKNVYSVGGYNISEKDLNLNILHANIERGVDVNYISEGSINGKILLQVFKLDRLNRQGNQGADGVLDVIQGDIIPFNLKNGKIYFPVLEPFGSHLRSQFSAGEQQLANKYVFQELYDSTKTAAQQIPAKNRFKMRGSYSSSSGSEIPLNAPNVPQGSVKVTAGGAPLTENVDYTVDYALGRVKIINQGILESGKPIKISLESNALFAFQTKSLIGTHLDYQFSKDFTLGGTVMNLTERPLTQKVNIGDEPISNTIVGLDGTYRTEAPFLTKLVDRIPLINTKEMSTLTVAGEVARLFPGHARAIGKEGISYIDDFEGSQSAIDLKQQQSWTLASVPQGQADLFPEGNLTNNLAYGYNRSKLAWYIIDPLFFRNNNLTPDHIKSDKVAQSNHFVREVLEKEIFPNRQNPNAIVTNLPILDFAYYPDERGPYNYTVAGLAADGKLKNPTSTWGGVIRRLETTDFEASNVDYIQFWMMDPFNDDNLAAPNTKGDLYFNIGDISEDVLKDSRKSFENGLPFDNPFDTNLVTNTNWGLVPTAQSLVNAFDNSSENRKKQDVGLDGYSNADEATFFANYISSVEAAFGANSVATTNAKADPSADDYKYFRSSAWDNASAPVLTRYREYNGLEGNSTTEQPDGYPTSSNTTPNTEDINRDNNLTQSENYFQYHINLAPGSMVLGQNYITDVVEAQAVTPNGTRNIKWYQFKIPIRSPERVVGDVDLRSMRFMRMFFKGFDQPIVCRFARLELIRGDWRKYNYSLLYPGEYIQDDNAYQTTFNIAAVNVEENSSKKPFNYVLPPGIDRQRNLQTTSQALLNEQSLSLSVCNLQDGDARATYKNVSVDMRNYKHLKMFAHAEAAGTEPLNTGDIKMFVRLGTDFDQNYYEYEYTLSVTPDGSTSREDIWQSPVNDMDITFSDLQNAKLQRNQDIINKIQGINLITPYTTTFDNGAHLITVVGNPNLSAVKTIMIGIRNPKRAAVTDQKDDGAAKCAQIWVNELSLEGFEEKGGWAALGRVQAKLADFADVTLASGIKTQGFGSIEQKLNERALDNTYNYDLSSNVRLGKFIPEKVGLNIPMYVGYSEGWIAPKYNPLDPDITTKATLDNYPDYKQDDRDSLAKIIKDYTRRKGINFTNVKKEKKGSGKSNFYDIENLSVSYAFNEVYKRNINTEYNRLKNYKGALAYNFNANPKNIKPFAKSKKLSSPYLQLIRDINYNTGPSRLSFRTDVDRNYNEVKTRNTTDGAEILILPTYNKTFVNNRVYDFKYDLTKAFSVDFTATNNASLDELDGKAFRSYDKSIDNERDSINKIKSVLIDNAKKFGRTTAYNHRTNATWNVPINKFPLLNWVTLTAKYSAGYDWTAAPLGSEIMGNNISNSNQKQLNPQLNMVTLYNKIPYFKKVNSPKLKAPPQKSVVKKDEKKDEKDPKKLLNEKDKKQKEPKDTTKTKLADSKFLAGIAKFIMTVKTISGTYSVTNGTILPGYLPKTTVFGMSDGRNVYNNSDFLYAPGYEFVFGKQSAGFAEQAGKNGWLSKSEYVNTPFTRTFNENINAKASLEPFKDLKIELTGTRTKTRNNQEIYKYDPLTDSYYGQSKIETGSFSVSIIALGTSFVKDDKDDHSSQVFKNFLAKREKYSAKLGEQNANSLSVFDGYSDGYNSTAQDVLLLSFVDAYSNGSANAGTIDAFKLMPKPNWRVSYDGLNKYALFKKYFKTISVTHAYRSSFNIGSYTTNLNYLQDENGADLARDISNNFIAKRQINVATISEQFSPLVGFDMTLQNSLLAKLELKRDRNISLSMANTQITEVKGNEIITGLGYRFKDVTIPFTVQGTKKQLKSDLNCRADVSIRKNNTVLRQVVTEINQVTAGQTVITLKFTADYVVSERLNIRLFYDRVITKPEISTSFKTSNTSSGVSIRFTIQ